MKQRNLVGITKAAEIVGVHPNTLRVWADKGIVPHVKLPSGYRRFAIEDLQEFRESLEMNEGKPVAA